MEILIAGAGSMGRGIGFRAVKGGHRLRIADRSPEKAEALAADLRHGASGEALGDVGGADIVVLATPYQGSLEIARRWYEQLAGKIVVDICNPVNFQNLDELLTPAGSSAAQQIAGSAPNALVVKAFNTTFARRLAAPGSLDVFIAGNDSQARGRVAEVCQGGGLRPIQVGTLKHAAALEAFQLLHMKVQDQIDGDWKTSLTIEP